MDLKDFIKETIKDISVAISEANEELAEIGTIVNPKDVSTVNSQTRENIYGYMLKQVEQGDLRRPVHLLHFDVAVSSAIKKDGKEGIGVKVVGISVGKDTSQGAENNTSSRLQFSIPIALPVGKRNS